MKEYRVETWMQKNSKFAQVSWWHDSICYLKMHGCDTITLRCVHKYFQDFCTRHCGAWAQLFLCPVWVVDPDLKNQVMYQCWMHPQHQLWLWGDRGNDKASPCMLLGLGNVSDTHNNYFPLTTSGTAPKFRFGLFSVFFVLAKNWCGAFWVGRIFNIFYKSPTKKTRIKDIETELVISYFLNQGLFQIQVSTLYSLSKISTVSHDQRTPSIWF